jgi:hypothetical protein
MHTVDGLTFVSILNLNMGFWTILLDKESQHYKRQCKNYGHLPTKIQRNIDLWNEVHVDLIGPWIIPQPACKSPKLSAKPDVKQQLQVLALTMINPSTNLLELIVVSDKERWLVPSIAPGSVTIQDPSSVVMIKELKLVLNSKNSFNPTESKQ